MVIDEKAILAWRASREDPAAPLPDQIDVKRDIAQMSSLIFFALLGQSCLSKFNSSPGSLLTRSICRHSQIVVLLDTRGERERERERDSLMSFKINVREID